MYINIEDVIKDIEILQIRIMQSNDTYNDFEIFYNMECLITLYSSLTKKNYQVSKQIKNKFEQYRKIKAKYLEKINMDDKKSYIIQSKNVIDCFNTKNINKKTNNKLFLTHQEMIELIEDFLSSYDERLIEEFRFLVDNKTIGIYKKLPNKIMGVCYDVSSLNKSYILCKEENSLETVSSIIHEFGHHLDRHNLVNIEARKQIWIEVNSIYLERLFLNYASSLYTNATIIKDALNSDIYTYFETALYDMENGINDYYLKMFLTYGYSSLVALEYEHLYLLDSELTKYNVDNFINSQGSKKNSLNMLEDFGLVKENIEQCKTLKKELHNSKYGKKYNG